MNPGGKDCLDLCMYSVKFQSGTVHSMACRFVWKIDQEEIAAASPDQIDQETAAAAASPWVYH